MVELTTLKDIKEFTIGSDEVNFCYEYSVEPEPFDYDFTGEQKVKMVKIEDLRKSAIEWIKAIEKGFNSEELHIDCNGNKGMLSWIKHRYNITEEDLKEGERKQ